MQRCEAGGDSMSNLTGHDGRAYGGPERRRNRVLVTRNSEYYCRDGRCVGVRDRGTGEFVRTHPALGKRMTGGMLLSSQGGMEVTSPESVFAGERLCFSSCDGDLKRDIITSPLIAVERPARDLAGRGDPYG
jgi:hypothetical protein